MERHALVYHLQRQRRLAQHVIARQPLTLYTTERRQLPRSLVLTPTTAAPPDTHTRHIPARMAQIMESSVADSSPTRPVTEPTTDASSVVPFDFSQETLLFQTTTNLPRGDAPLPHKVTPNLLSKAVPGELSESYNTQRETATLDDREQHVLPFAHEQQPIANPTIPSISEKMSTSMPDHASLQLSVPPAIQPKDEANTVVPDQAALYPTLLPTTPIEAEIRTVIPDQAPVKTALPPAIQSEEKTSIEVIDHISEPLTSRQETTHNELKEAKTDSEENNSTDDRIESHTTEKSDRSAVLHTSSEAKPTPPQDHDSHRVRLIEEVKPRPRRGRITETPTPRPTTEQAQDSTSTPQTSPPQQPHMPTEPSRRTAKAEKERTPPSEADTLFLPRETPREPLEWLAMLRKSRWGDLASTPESPTPSPTSIPAEDISTPIGKQSQNALLQPHVAPFLANTNAQSEQTAQIVRQIPDTHANISSELSSLPAEPLSQRTRRFLRPLLGFDPAQVRVHRSAPAARVAASHQADAVAIGNDIAIGTGHSDNEPQTLGLLAHELTHIARRHEPRFIPPIVQGRKPTTGNQQTRPAFKGSTGVSPSAPTSPARLPTPTDEEPLAQLVEQQVARLASEEPTSSTLLRASTTPERPVYPSAHPNDRASDASLDPTHDTNWGNLPAPWEPLPDWLTSSPTALEQSTTSPSNTPLAPQVPTIVTATSGNIAGAQAAGGTGNNVVQRAGLERSLSTTQTNQAAPSAVPNITQGPEPNLDELAQQVYTLLKRRLGVEHRRMS